MARADHVQSLERGLLVLRCFDAEHPEQTLSEVAKRTGLTRATARRLLLTLSTLGYATTDGRNFSLTPAVLNIGYAYLSSLNVQQIGQPFLESLSEKVHESASISVLDGGEVVYVARVPTTRIMTIAPRPRHAPAGVLHVDGSSAAERSCLPRTCGPGSANRSPRSRSTRSPTSTTLEAELAKVRSQGWALVDQELEMGLRSVAAPLRDSSGRTIASINVSTHAGRTTMKEVHQQFLPALLETAAGLNDALRQR